MTSAKQRWTTPVNKGS